MSANVAADMRNKLLVDGVVNTSTWPCYIGMLPDDQDKCVGVFITGGLAADTLGRENRLPTFQVVIRGAQRDYEEVLNKWEAVFQSLQDANYGQVSPDYLEDYSYIQAMATSPVCWTDDKERVLMSVNFRAHKLA